MRPSDANSDIQKVFQTKSCTKIKYSFKQHFKTKTCFNLKNEGTQMRPNTSFPINKCLMLSNIGMPETTFDVNEVYNNMYCTDMLTFPMLSVWMFNFKKCVYMLIHLGDGSKMAWNTLIFAFLLKVCRDCFESPSWMAKVIREVWLIWEQCFAKRAL